MSSVCMCVRARVRACVHTCMLVPARSNCYVWDMNMSADAATASCCMLSVCVCVSVCASTCLSVLVWSYSHCGLWMTATFALPVC